MTRALVAMMGAVGLMVVGCQNSSSAGDPAAASASAAVSAAPADRPEHDRPPMMDRGDGGGMEHGDHPPPMMMGDGGMPPEGFRRGGPGGDHGGHERH